MPRVRRRVAARGRAGDAAQQDQFPRYTEAGKKFKDALEAIPGAYNYNRSDSMTDFFSTNFHLDVGFDWEWEKAAKDALFAKATG